MELPMYKTRSSWAGPVFSVLVGSLLSGSAIAQSARFNYAQLISNNGFSAPTGVAADANGNLYVADTGNNAVKEVAPGCILASCAVTLGSGFSSPGAIAVDASGDVFLADTGNHAVKEILAVNGSIPASPTIKTLGSGFSSPSAIAIDKTGNLFVVDKGNNTVKEIPAAGGYTTVTTISSAFTAPSGVAVDASGDVFVTDSTNNVVREILAVSGSIPASPTINTIASGFSRPAGVAVDGSGDVFVADTGNAVLKELVAVNGSVPASPTIVTFGTGLGTPTGVILGSNGAIYTADPKNNDAVVLDTQAVNLGTVSVYSHSGTFSLVFTFTGSGTVGAPGVLSMGASGLDFIASSTGTTCKAGSVTAGSTCILNLNFVPQFAGVRSGAVVLYDASTPANVLATVYLAGVGYGSLANFPPGNISTIAGTGAQGSSGDTAAATAAKLNAPGSVAFDGAGNLYLTDTGNGRIREVNATTGIITTFAGSGSGCSAQANSFGDGCAATSAVLSSPAAIALDGAGNLYIADTGNHRIRVVNSSTGVIQTVAGGGTGCAAQTDTLGDGCPATSAAISTPSGIAVDSSGNLYIADTQDGVRVVSAISGTISEVAAVTNPSGIALDNAGSLYISEPTSGLVQKVNLLTGAVTTVAGGGIGCTSETSSTGDGCPATQVSLTSPGGIVLDPGGDLYIADQAAGVVRVVSAASGTISTAAGGGTGCTAQTDSAGDGCPATSATITPAGVALDTKANLYIADTNGQRIRKVDLVDPPTLVFPNTPVAGSSPTQFVTAGSAGTAPLHLGGYILTGQNFNVDEANATCSIGTRVLNPGQTCIFGILFEPRTAGPITSAVTFVDDAPGLGQNVPVSGTATPEVTPPAPVITGEPANPTVANYATFTFTDTNANVSFVCSLNGASYSPCQSPMSYPSLQVNTVNTFYVEALDIYGLASTGTSYTWNIVTAPPIPTFTAGPATTTTLTTGLITFTDAQAGVTFLCSLDSAAFAPCTSGVTLSGLAVGAHTFAVEAQQAPGIVSGTATLLWTILPPPPPTPVATAGTATAANFGTIPVGQTSPKTTITFTFSLGGKIASSAALTLGAPNLDFALLSSGTCAAGSTFTTGSSCTVDVTFTPKFAGLRKGAVVLSDALGNAIATGYLQGTGSGPQVRFSPYTQTSLGGGFATPSSIALDGAGNLYVADETNAVKVIPAGCTSITCTTTLGQGFLGVNAVALDGAGNVFVTEDSGGKLLEIAPGCTTENCVKTLSSSLTNPIDLAVDASGNVFVADQGPPKAGSGVNFPNGSVKEFTAASGYATANTVVSGVSFLDGLAVDGADNVFVAIGDDLANSAVEEIPAAGNYSAVNTLNTTLYGPASPRLDSVGNLYLIDLGYGVLQMLPASSNYSTATTVVSYGANTVPYGIALEGSGNIYTAVPNAQGGGVFKLDYVDPPVLSFATTSVGLTDTVDGTETVALQNIGNAPLTLTSVTPPVANWTIVGSATTCANASTVAAGASCSVGIQFAPTASGRLSDAFSFTDNALNVTVATQTVSLSGAAENVGSAPPAPVITGNPANPSGTSTATFTFTDTQPAVTFLCSLDGAAYSTCTSGVTYPSLASGAHTFGVRAADSLNNQSAIATFNWTIAIQPVPNIDQAPANPTTATTATFAFTDATPGGSFVCSLDSAAYSSCTSGIAYTSLAAGAHTFAVEYESSSNVFSAPATWNWTIGTSLTFQPGNAQDFGTVAVGQSSATLSLTYTFTAAATLGAPVALTEGAPNLDYAVAGGTCATGASFTQGQTCTVNVTFTPSVSGLRRGAVMLADHSGNTVAMIYVHGIGAGPQLQILSSSGYAPASSIALGGGFAGPYGIAVDGAGNTYVADQPSQSVKKVPAGCTSASCVITLGTNMNAPYGVAVDGAGNVYVGENSPSTVQEIPYGCASNSCIVSLGGGFFGPEGVAVDGSGNVFVADYVNNAIKKMPPNCRSIGCVSTIGSGFIGPEGVAVDAAGNVFVVQYGLGTSSPSGTTGCNNNICISNTVALLEIPAAGGYSTVKTLQSGFNSPLFLALDANANVYISEVASGIGQVQELTASSGYAAGQPLNLNCGTVAGSYCNGTGVAVDGSGNVYVADVVGKTVSKLNFSSGPAAFSFPTPTVAGTVDFNDVTNGVILLNIGNAPLNLTSVSATTNFFGSPIPCSTTNPVSAGYECAVYAYFAPVSSGPLTGTLTITDNNLNATAATQQFALSGTGLPPAPTITSKPANGTSTGTATFAFTDASTNVTSYLCSLDGSTYASCASGVTYSSVTLGSHTFSVEGVDSSSNVSAPTSYTWVEIPSSFIPAPVITSEPTNPTASTTATFTFTDAEPGVFYTCLFVTTAPTFSIQAPPCASGVTYNTVVNDSYELEVFASDPYGNVSATTTYSWSVVSTAPGAQPPPPPLPTTSAANFGSEPIAQTTAPISLTLSFTSYGTGTIGSIQALTHGAPNLDFALAPGGSCAVGSTYTATTTCTVNATFTPTLAGYRKGAVVIKDNAGNTLAIGYIQGVGTGPQVAFLPGIISTYATLTGTAIAAGGYTESQISADGAGNIYVPNWYSNTVQIIPPGCHTTSCAKTAYGNAYGTSVDGAGNLFMAEFYPVVMAPRGCYSQACETPINGFNLYPYNNDGADGIFADGAGNLYVAGEYNYSGVEEATAATGYSTPVQFGGTSGNFGSPRSIAADVNGNIFVASDYGGALEVPPGCTAYSCVKVLIPSTSTSNFIFGMGMDGVGNAYFQTSGLAGVTTIYKSLVGNNYATYNTVASNLTGTLAAIGLGTDDLGNVYIPNFAYQGPDVAGVTINTTISKIDFNTPPTITFPTTTPAGSSDTTDGALTVTINNNGNGPMTFTGFSVAGASFALNSAATTCSTSTPLAAQTTCNIAVTFAPTSVGTLTGTLTVTDNTLNAPGTTQLIPLVATGTGTSSLTPTTTALTASSTTPTAGASVTFTATVTPNTGSVTPTGTVIFTDGAFALGTATLNASGVATFTTSKLAVGPHAVVANYGGDSKSAASASTTVNVTVAPAVVSTTTLLSAFPLTIPVGGSLALTAQVTPTSGTGSPTGIATFYDGATSLGTGTLNVNGTATLTNTTLAAGVHTIKAVYAGDSYNTTSTSNTVSVTVLPFVSTTTLVQASANPVATGSFVTFTATVVPASGTNVPSGIVYFMDGTTSLGASVLNASGAATLTTNSLALGTHFITAAYKGDTYDNVSTSAALNVTVVASVIATTTHLSAATTAIAAGGTATLTAAVVPTTGHGTPTGNVVFLDGSTTLCTVALNTNASATCTAALTQMGTHSITASYGGDNSNLGSVSAAITITAGADPSATTLQPSSSSIAANNPLTLLVNVKPVVGTGVPTGTVTFLDGTTSLGTATLTSRGSASIDTSALTVGLHTLTATYGGDSSNLASNSGAVLISVTILSTTTQLDASASTVAPGARVTFTASVAPASGAGTPTGSITFQDGTTTLGTGTLNSGVATFSTTSLAAGPHSVTAVYSGDAKDSASTSGAVSVSVSNSTVATVTALQASNTTPTFGGSVTFTATVAPASGTNVPTGTVNFLDGATPLGSASLSGSGIATYATAFLAVGPHSITASYAGDSKDNASVSNAVNVTVAAVPAPSVTLGPGSLVFTANEGATSAAQSATLTNSGNATLTLGGIAIVGVNPGGFKETTTCGATLVAGASCTISIAFAPTSVTGYQATLSVSDNATGSPHTVALSGTGTAAPVVQALLSPNPLAFPGTLVGVAAAPLPMTLSNPGTAALTISGISVTGANATSFSQTNNCGSSLAAGGSCTITVSFTPASAGSLTAAISVSDNATGSPQSATITGTGTQPQAMLSPNPLAFPNTLVGAPATPLPLTLSNPGTAPLAITSISVTGTNAGSFTQTNTCGASLAAGATCTITVTFTPASTGSLTAAISVADSASGSPHTAVLTGTGIAPQAVLTPNPLAFPSTTVNTAATPLPIALSNPGTAPLAIASIALTGPNAGSFSQANTCGASLAAGATCTITVAFTPASLGALTAAVTVTDSASGSPHSATLTGTGTAPLIPQAVLSPNPLTFPSTSINTAATPLPMTLSNPGNTPLAISGIAVTGANAGSFSATNNCGTSLAVGASCTITVGFTPASAGTFTAAITITDNAPGSPQSAALTGTGSAGTYVVTSPVPTQSIQPGALAQFNVLVNPVGGSFNNVVTLSATGLPPGATVSFLPPTVTPGTAGATSVMSIQTSSGLAHLAAPAPIRQNRTPLFALVAGIPLLGLAGSLRRGRWLLLALIALSLLPMMALAGCGGGYFGPPPQTYTITVTGSSGSLTTSTTVSLTVQ
jgi:sugar lactone lactonase YvrE